MFFFSFLFPVFTFHHNMQNGYHTPFQEVKRSFWRRTRKSSFGKPGKRLCYS